MDLFQPNILGPFWGFSEFGLTLFKRSRSGAVSKDRNSLGLIWAANLGSIASGIWVAYHHPEFKIHWPPMVRSAGMGLFLFGFTLRWYAIIHLGRFFTTNVAIAADHTLVDTGPYRFIRHPSYTGGILMVLGFCLSFYNWVSLLIILIGSLAATLWRIHIEEAALSEGLGEPYRAFKQRTKRLIPFIY